MRRGLFFIEIVVAVFVGSLAKDVFLQSAQQCISKDSNGCAETRVDCIWNSRKTPSIIPVCFIDPKV